MSLVIYCDGGLGNRLNSLRGGLNLAREIGSPFVILWPINRMCEASLEDMFDTHLKTLNIGLDQVLAKYNIQVAITHEGSSFSGLPIIDPRNYFRLTTLLRDLKRHPILNGGKILYYNSQHPPYIWSEVKSNSQNLFLFKQDTVVAAEEFLNEYCLKETRYLALHLRGTDYGFPSIYFSFWRALINLIPCKTVLCTDDMALVNKFSGLKNIYWKKSEALPQKLDGLGSWDQSTIDEYGREFNYNLFRNAASIKNALIELYLLSRGVRIYTSRSTFLYQAYLFDPKLKGRVHKAIEASHHFMRALKRLILG